MVRRLPHPQRPLPAAGSGLLAMAGSRWIRIYHHGSFAPTGDTPRVWGPRARFDPQRPGPAGATRIDPDSRSVLYAGEDLATSACEVFGEARAARICPRWRAAAVQLRETMLLLDLTAKGSAIRIGALPQLADADLPRTLTQQWARAIYEDDPLGRHVDGIAYRTAYYGGLAVTLWDSANRLHIVDDRALQEPGMLDQLTADLNPLGIQVDTTDSADCVECAKDPSPA